MGGPTPSTRASPRLYSPPREGGYLSDGRRLACGSYEGLARLALLVRLVILARLALLVRLVILARLLAMLLAIVARLY